MRVGGGGELEDVAADLQRSDHADSRQVVFDKPALTAAEVSIGWLRYAVCVFWYVASRV